MKKKVKKGSKKIKVNKAEVPRPASKKPRPRKRVNARKPPLRVVEQEAVPIPKEADLNTAFKPSTQPETINIELPDGYSGVEVVRLLNKAVDEVKHVAEEYKKEGIDARFKIWVREMEKEANERTEANIKKHEEALQRLGWWNKNKWPLKEFREKQNKVREETSKIVKDVIDDAASVKNVLDKNTKETKMENDIGSIKSLMDEITDKLNKKGIHINPLATKTVELLPVIEQKKVKKGFFDRLIHWLWN